MVRRMRLALLLAALSLMACPTAPAVDAGEDFDAPGPYATGVTHLTVGTDGGRALPVEVWYPAQGSATADFAVETFEADPVRSAQLKTWVEAAPAKCTPRRALGTRDAPHVNGSFPLIVFSHCDKGFRFSMHTLAARLASHGFFVAAPDHVDNTLFDAGAPLNDAFLAVRADDIEAVIDVMLSSGQFDVDASRVAMVGHSFGAVTTARVVEIDARVKGGFLIAAPADSILNNGGLTRVTRPLSWVLAVEDNSISSIGNDLIRDNFLHAPKPTWLFEVENAGHWSFSDIAGLGGNFMPGCGDGVRELDGGTFTYLDNDEARALAARTITAWARFTVDGDEHAKAALGDAHPGVGIKTR